MGLRLQNRSNSPKLEQARNNKWRSSIRPTSNNQTRASLLASTRPRLLLRCSPRKSWLASPKRTKLCSPKALPKTRAKRTSCSLRSPIHGSAKFEGTGHLLNSKPKRRSVASSLKSNKLLEKRQLNRWCCSGTAFQAQKLRGLRMLSIEDRWTRPWWRKGTAMASSPRDRGHIRKMVSFREVQVPLTRPKR